MRKLKSKLIIILIIIIVILFVAFGMRTTLLHLVGFRTRSYHPRITNLFNLRRMFRIRL